MPFICVCISASSSLPHPTPEGSWWFSSHYQRVPMNKNKHKVIWGIWENYFSPQANVKAKLGVCTQLGNLLTNTKKKLDVMKHIHFKSQVTARGGFCQTRASSSLLLKMTVSAFNYFQRLCSLPVNSLLSYSTEALPTFHCKVKELLVLCEGLGGKGHSGAELWVVKLTGSEQDPFTELYIAYILGTIFKWVINLLTVTRWDSVGSATIFDYQNIHNTIS